VNAVWRYLYARVCGKKGWGGGGGCIFGRTATGRRQKGELIPPKSYSYVKNISKSKGLCVPTRSELRKKEKDRRWAVFVRVSLKTMWGGGKRGGGFAGREGGGGSLGEHVGEGGEKEKKKKKEHRGFIASGEGQMGAYASVLILDSIIEGGKGGLGGKKKRGKDQFLAGEWARKKEGLQC